MEDTQDSNQTLNLVSISTVLVCLMMRNWKSKLFESQRVSLPHGDLSAILKRISIDANIKNSFEVRGWTLYNYSRRRLSSLFQGDKSKGGGGVSVAPSLPQSVKEEEVLSKTRSRSLNHNLVHPGWGYQCPSEQDAGPGCISRLWYLRDLQQDALVALQIEKKHGVHKPSHSSELQTMGWHCKRHQEPGQGISNQAQMKGVKIPVLEGDKGNLGKNNSEGDQTSLGLEEAKVLELKEQQLDLGEEYILKATAEGNRSIGIAGSEKIQEHQTYSAEPPEMQQRLMRH
ncbi:hypothetical protein DUI87_18492 [Hirundo rustica rustica]|uniref:Uncharacterized protein n=1 Tax=Hirundo rustica rustica TaxID=333673 RepID=A0A3M0JX04_HIRRU|nr:hypothetical protein DUI87_18492 [Hirundo rustica rustica]